MDIEERAEKWAREKTRSLSPDDVILPGMQAFYDKLQDLLAEAYLAGSAQTQADYAKHFCL